MKCFDLKKSKKMLRSLLVFAMAFVVMSSTVLTAYAGTYASLGATVKVEHIFEDNNNVNHERDKVGEIDHKVDQVVNNSPAQGGEGDNQAPPVQGGEEDDQTPPAQGGEEDDQTPPAQGGEEDDQIPPAQGGEGDGQNPPVQGGDNQESEAPSIPTIIGSSSMTATGDLGSGMVVDEEEQKARDELIGEIKGADNESISGNAEEIWETVEELIGGTDSGNLWEHGTGVDISSNGNTVEEKDEQIVLTGQPYQYQMAITSDSAAKLEAAGYETTQLKITITVVGKIVKMKDDNGVEQVFVDTDADMVYVSIDGGKTWIPANGNAEGHVFDPATDYVRETMYTFLHVLTPKTTTTTPPPTPPTTPPSTPPSAPPSTPPSETPTPMPTPSVTPTPTPSSTPTPGVDIQDEDVPLSVFIPSDEVEIFDEEVPLADVPLTADDTDVWYTIVALSACGLMILLFTGKRKKEA